MAAFNKFNLFTKALAEKVHNLATDQLMVALTNAANPPAAANAVLGDLTQIAYTNCSTRNVVTFSSTSASGVYKLKLTDLVLTAAGGAIADFRYVVLYNDTATNKELIGFYDYGSDLTVADTETLTIDFDATAGVLTVT